ncbi:unnamed protein product [Symbiodinium sp. CCMP2592]|nr:unnamed protein product [Symbiodinium sp. CCMP2592]
MDLFFGRISIPGFWLTVSHISGPTLINTSSACRHHTDQAHQFAQFAALHRSTAVVQCFTLQLESHSLDVQLPGRRRFPLRSRSRPCMFIRRTSRANEARLDVYAARR